MKSLLKPLGLGTLEVRGPDAQSWLNGLLSQDLGRLSPGVAIPALFLTKQGKVRASLFVVGKADHVTLAIAGPGAQEFASELDSFLVMEDAEWAVDSSVDWYVGQLSESERARLVGHPQARVYGVELLGPDGVLIQTVGGLPSELLLPEPSTEAEFEEFRIDLGIPLFGVDYGEADNPHEASLDKTHINFKKGCYLGQEVVCMQEMRGKVKRRIVRVRAEEGVAALKPGLAITSEAGDEAGLLTTAHGSRGLGRVKAPFDAPGSTVLVGGVSCRVAPLDPGFKWAGEPPADRVLA